MSGAKNFVLPDQAARDLIRHELGRNLIVEAAAGTGKTTGMVGRMVELLAAGACDDIGQIAAVTFTRKAAAELRGRFRLALESASADPVRTAEARARLEAGLRDADRAFIGTIHAFCAKLLRERPVEADVDASFTEIDQDDDKTLRDQSWDEYLNLLHADDRDGLLAALMDEGVDLVGLKSSFRRFAEFPDVDLWPLPAPEPTTGLAERIALVHEYADHMTGFHPSLPDDPDTDELIPCYRIVPRMVRHRGRLTTLPQCEPVLSQLCRKPKLVRKHWVKTKLFTKEEAEREKQRWDDFQARVALPLLSELRRRRYPLVLRTMAGARAVYDRRRRELGVLNFQDLLLLTRDLLRDHPLVRRDFSERFTHLLVDEFQDTDPIQAEILFLLAADDPNENEWRQCRPRPGSLFVVGDPKQSIYRFRRADIMTYNEVKRLLTSGPPETVGLELRLSANFRAVPAVINAVNRIFEPDGNSSGEALLRFPAAAIDESPAYVPLTVGRPESGGTEFEGLYRLDVPRELNNKEEVDAWESDEISRFIRRAVDDGLPLPGGAGPRPARWSDFLIVTRNKGRLNVYAQALARYGIPHQVTGGSALAQTPELELLRLALLAVAHPDHPVHLLAVLRSELFGVSDRDLYLFKRAGGRFTWQSRLPEGLDNPSAERIGRAWDSLKKFAGWFAVMPSTAALERMAGDLGLIALAAGRPGGDVAAGGLMKVIELARASERESWSPAQLAEYLGELADADEKYDSLPARSPEDEVVRVMNLHQVKGLEAPVVFLADPNGGDVRHEPLLHVERGQGGTRGFMVFGGERGRVAEPEDWDAIAAAEERFQRAEELRLRYVAATRAGVALIVTQRETYQNRNPWRELDPFLDQPLETPEPFDPAATELVTISAEEPVRAAEEISRRLSACRTVTRRTASVRELALPAHAAPEEAAKAAADFGEHGLEWGALMHSVLQAAMDRPQASIEDLASAIAREEGLEPRLGFAAAEAAKSIVASEIWRRGLKSPERYTELPFEIMMETAEGPTLVRGALDLIFREPDGWVLIDYKTDILDRRSAAEVAEFYRPQLTLYAAAFSRLTGSRIKQAGFYFLRADRVEWVKISSP